LWVEALSGPNPLRQAVNRAWREHEQQLAARRAALGARREQLDAERDELESERLRLETGATPVPPAPYTRDAAGRAGRAGAPLWQLVDFSPDVNAADRAGLEAALEASGLLDAWVAPDGTVWESAAHDVVLTKRGICEQPLSDWLVPSAPPEGPGAVSPITVSEILGAIACAARDPQLAEAWISPRGEFRLGPTRGAWAKSEARYIGHSAREAARLARLGAIRARLGEIATALEGCAVATTQIDEQRARAVREQDSAPSDEPLLRAHADRAATEQIRRHAQENLGEADARLASAENALARARDALELDAESLRLPRDTAGIERLAESVDAFRLEAGELVNAVREHQDALTELGLQLEREARAREDAQAADEERLAKRRTLLQAQETLGVLQESVGKAVEDLLRDLQLANAARDEHKTAYSRAQRQWNEATREHGAAQTHRDDLREQLSERTAARRQAADELQAFASLTGLFSAAVPDVPLPDPAAPWSIEAALGAARRAEQVLADVTADEPAWNRVQNAISRDLAELQTAMSAQGHKLSADVSDYGLGVSIFYHERPQRPDTLQRLLDGDIEARRLTLTAKEREILESHLEKEIAANLQRRIIETEERVRRINTELEKRPTSTGVRFRLDWQPLPEHAEGSVAGLIEARKRLLKTNPDAWSPEDRREVGEFLQARITAERSREEQSTLVESLARALDYRRWHRFRVQRQQDRQWRPLSGPASSGERALGLTVPLFAGASSHYWSAHEHAPRLVLLDEAFAGIDDEARAGCMALIREFDLDFVMTSEREWGCYPELPGLAICQLIRREGMDAVLVTRWTWNGRERRREEDLVRRFPPAESSAGQDISEARGDAQLDLTS